MEVTKKSIVKEINDLASRAVDNYYNGIEFRCDNGMLQFTKEVCEKLNKAQGVIEEETDRIAFIERVLFKLWCGKTTGEEFGVFGEMYTKYAHKGMIATLSAKGTQFRIWGGFPGTISSDHAESGGGHLILNVGGHKDIVKRYKDMYVKYFTTNNCIKFEIPIENGSKLYMAWE
jgi:hypothetical protein